MGTKTTSPVGGRRLPERRDVPAECPADRLERTVGELERTVGNRRERRSDVHRRRVDAARDDPDAVAY